MNNQEAAQPSQQARLADLSPHQATHGRSGVEEHIVALAWSPQGDALAVAGADGGVYLLDAQPEPRLRRIGEHAGGALSVGFIRGGTHLVSGGQDDELQIHGRDADVPSRKLAMHSNWVEHMSTSVDGELLAVSAGRHVQLYQADTLSLLHTFAPLPATVAGLAFAPRGRQLAAASYGGVQLLTALPPYRTRTLAWTGSCVAMAWRPDASIIAAGGQDASVQFWRLSNGQRAAMSGYPTKVRELAWDRTGRWLATGGGSSVALWDFKTGPEGHLPRMLHGHVDRIVGMRWQRRGPMLASVSRDGTLMLWRPGQGDMPLKAFGVAFMPTALAWAPNDRLLAIGGDGGQLAVIDTTDIEA